MIYCPGEELTWLGPGEKGEMEGKGGGGVFVRKGKEKLWREGGIAQEKQKEK